MNDEQTRQALARVDAARRELREAEDNLKVELAAFSRRHNYGANLRECHVRWQLENDKEKAATWVSSTARFSPRHSR